MAVSVLVEYIIPKPITERNNNANITKNIAMPRSRLCFEDAKVFMAASFPLVTAHRFAVRRQRTVVQLHSDCQRRHWLSSCLRVHQMRLHGEYGVNRIDSRHRGWIGVVGDGQRKRSPRLKFHKRREDAGVLNILYFGLIGGSGL